MKQITMAPKYKCNKMQMHQNTNVTKYKRTENQGDKILYFVFFGFWYFCIQIYLYFIPFVFCCICISAIFILCFRKLSCLYFGIFAFCFIHILLYLCFVIFVFWLFVFCTFSFCCVCILVIFCFLFRFYFVAFVFCYTCILLHLYCGHFLLLYLVMFVLFALCHF